MNELKDEKKRVLSTDIRQYGEKENGIIETPKGYQIIKEPYTKHKKLQ